MEKSYSHECAICFEDMHDLEWVRLACSTTHNFCENCMKEWNLRNPSCPMCRNPILRDVSHRPESRLLNSASDIQFASYNGDIVIKYVDSKLFSNIFVHDVVISINGLAYKDESQAQKAINFAWSVNASVLVEVRHQKFRRCICLLPTMCT